MMENTPALVPEISPESPSVMEPPTLGPRIGMACLASAIFYIVTVAVSVVVVVAFMISGTPLNQLLLLLVGQLTAWPAAMIAGTLLCKRPWRESYSIRGFSLRLLPGIVLSSVGLSFVLNRLSTAIPMPKAFEEMFKSLAHGDPILSILSLAIIAPIAEELFFRGWMLRGFFANYSAKKSIWMTALIFGLFHLNPWQFLVAMPIGLLFGWLVLRTDSLAPSMIGHCVFNFTGVKLLLPLAALFGHSEESINAMTHLPWDMVAFGALLFGVGMVLLLRALPSPNDTTAPVPVNA